MSYTKLGLVKVTALAALCAAGLGMPHSANAGGFFGYSGHDGHNRYSVSIGLGGPYYGGGYYRPRAYYYAPRRYYSYAYAPSYYDYSYAPAYYPGYDAYYNGAYGGGYYGGGVSYGISYGGSYGRGWDRDDRRWRGDHDRDDRRPGGWDRNHYRYDSTAHGSDDNNDNGRTQRPVQH